MKEGMKEGRQEGRKEGRVHYVRNRVRAWHNRVE
jgi:predicted transposase YdaD